MINRILIRIKVVQMAYSYLLVKNEKSLVDARKELVHSLDKAYELYNYLLLLIVELTHMQELRIDEARNKYLPSEEELNPNMRFVENELAIALKNNEKLMEFVKDKSLSWDDDVFIKLILDKILHSEEYKNYMALTVTDYETDCDFWKKIMRDIILVDEDLASALEAKSVYWNDDVDVLGTFVLKTIKRIQDRQEEVILPQYKDEEDSRFGVELFDKTISYINEGNELIDKFVKTESWDKERIAFMDRVIMNVCMAEIRDYPSIPISVSMNEYIEIAKYYSTAKSGQFINGILNTIVKYMKAENIINKN